MEFLMSKPVGPWSKSDFDDDVPLSEGELQRLLSLPEGQRMSYDPADEIVVQKRFADIKGKTLSVIKRMFPDSTED